MIRNRVLVIDDDKEIFKISFLIPFNQKRGVVRKNILFGGKKKIVVFWQDNQVRKGG